ncbi:MAG TPA: AraC family transcriptional regulator [Gammaproteobacteria bacterium]|nr:AraC family transcriptional regulator [Gammaproteobacteria bacterium]
MVREVAALKPTPTDDRLSGRPRRAKIEGRAIRVGFILLDHFSMMSYASAVDALVTANLVSNDRLFSHSNFGISDPRVPSDLGIDLSTDGLLTNLNCSQDTRALDVIVVIGGYRSPLMYSHQLTEKLKSAASHELAVGGVWNGSLALVQAGLMHATPVALHPDNHALLREKYPAVRLADKTHEISTNRLSAAGPSSTLEMMLEWLDFAASRDVARAVREILAPDSLSASSISSSHMLQNDPSLPEALRSALQLMRANIEEPLTSEELAACVNLSRRQIERLFQSHLGTSPSRYYFELRLTQAQRLLVQTSDSITRISLACGFVSSSHFSNCFKDFFGESPSVARKKNRVVK